MSGNHEREAFHSNSHFSFETTLLDEEIAHGGTQPILAKRVLTIADLGANHVDLVIVPPGADIGLHTHESDNQELYIIISGSGHMTVDNQQIRVDSGHVVVNRPGGTHSLWNPGPEEIRIVVVEVPEAGRYIGVKSA
jgi:mannose-6-phosphate isomerase-like protein (cupin superfamily)